MNIFQIVCFVTLSDTSTFSEAAEKLYVSQSSFSNNIQSIEKELGVSLVIRGARALSLTEAGRAFLIYAEKIVKEYDRMTGLLMDYKQGAQNRVSIYTDPLSSYGYNPTLVSFKLNFPDIQTDVTELVSENFADILKSRDDAVGIIFSTKREAASGTKNHVLVSDRLAAFVNESHRLAGRKRLKIHDLRNETLQIISHRQSPFLYEFVTSQCGKAGFSPNVALYDIWYSTIQELIRERNLPAIIPEKAAKIFCAREPEMRVIGLDADEFFINVVISDKCTHSAALSFFEFAKTAENDL